MTGRLPFEEILGKLYHRIGAVDRAAVNDAAGFQSLDRPLVNSAAGIGHSRNGIARDLFEDLSVLEYLVDHTDVRHTVKKTVLHSVAGDLVSFVQLSDLFKLLGSFVQILFAVEVEGSLDSVTVEELYETRVVGASVVGSSVTVPALVTVLNLFTCVVTPPLLEVSAPAPTVTRVVE